MGAGSLRPDGFESAFEAELDEFLARLGAEGDVDACAEARRAARSLPDPETRSLFVGAALAYDWLWRRERGETTEVGERLSQLASELERSAFETVLAGDARARRVLPDTHWAPGRRIAGRYLIIDALGQGGMSSVFRAFDLELERDVALKVLELRPGSEQDWRQTVLAESRVLASLPGRGFAQVYDIGSVDGRGYLVLELLPGLDLARVLHALAPDPQHPPPPETRAASARKLLGSPAGDEEDLLAETDWFRVVARIGQRLAAHLELAHASGLRHRDIKPSNVQLLPGGAPLLMDFGLAARVGGRGAVGAEGEPEPLRGSLPYLAPEQASSRSTGTDPRSDVYQLGLVLYELACLRPARPRPEGPVRELGEWLTRMACGDVRPLSEVEPRAPRALAAILDHALRVAPEQRYASAGALAADLARLLEGRTPLHAPLPPGERVRMVARRQARRPTVYALAAVLLALAFGRRFAGVDELELTPILWHTGLPVPTRMTPGEPLDVVGPTALGVDLSASTRTWLYALSIFEDEQGVRRVRAVSPELLGAPEPAPPGRFGLELAAGRTSAVCAWLLEPEAVEGFVAFASASPQPLLERWIGAIAGRDERLLGAMPWEEAQELGRSLLATSRGEGGTRLDPAQRERLFAGLTAQRSPEDDPWQRLGVRSVGFLAPVRRPGAPR